MKCCVTGSEIMIELGMSFAESSPSCGAMSDAVSKVIKDAISDYVKGISNYIECSTIMMCTVGTAEPLDQLREILEVPEVPLPPQCEVNLQGKNHAIRKKTRPWTTMEDRRLLAAVARFGIDNWQGVSKFVGNGRNRAQCSQRFIRCLDPHLSRKPWTFAENDSLRQLVSVHGTGSWMRISYLLGNRSDVQCRYHYSQLMRTSKADEQLSHCTDNEDGDKMVNSPESLGTKQMQMAAASEPMLEIESKRLILPRIGSLPMCSLCESDPCSLGVFLGQFKSRGSFA